MKREKNDKQKSGGQENARENNPEKQYRIMLNTPVRRLVVKLAFPTVVSLLITSVYNLADGFFVSRVGESKAENIAASGAVGVVFSIMALTQAIGFTFGTGAGNIVSRSLGDKNAERADSAAVTALVMAILAGGLLSAAGLFFLEPLLRLLGATPTVLPYAKAYARYILLAAPIMTAAFVLNNLLRAEGKTMLSMVGLALGGGLNILLDPLFLFALDWGIAGAAIATLISQSVSLLFMLFCFFSKKTALSLHPRFLARKASFYLSILAVGLPSLFRQGLASAAAVLLNNAAAGFGDAAISAMSIVNKVFMLMFCVALGLGQGYQPVVGYNYSAGRNDRVREAFRFTFYCGTLLMLLIGALLYFSAPWVVKVMIRGHREVVGIGTRALRFQCLAMPFIPLNVVCNMTFQAVGKKFAASFLASCRQGIFFLPLILILPRVFFVTGLTLAQPLSDFLTFLMSIPYAIVFLKGLSKKDFCRKNKNEPREEKG